MEIGKIAKKWDITGKRYGRLEVISYAGKDARNNTAWLCRCDCGAEKVIRRVHLVDGASSSCGCYQREVNGSWSKTHGMAGTPTYNTWQAMLDRCNRQGNVSYERYGARGIKVCERWNVFGNFLIDMGVKPDGCVIDRKDNNGDYEPFNCRWSTYQASSRNREATKLNFDKVSEIRSKYPTRKITMAKFASEYNVHPQTIYSILNGRNWRIHPS